ncbi:MAG TPA: hypothetical protein EYG88_01645 [Desulfocapsa sulfexigens]|nr:hypothetical protein [Desulfocapsa sulfexigens]
MKTRMKTKYSLYLLIVGFLFLFCLTDQSVAGDKVQLDILHMNHGPMRPTIAKIKVLLESYTDTIQASWYDFDTPAGKKFMKKQKLTGHIPMLLMLDGESDFSIESRDVRLSGFPTGASPFKKVEGNWSLDDLKIIFDQKTDS